MKFLPHITAAIGGVAMILAAAGMIGLGLVKAQTGSSSKSTARNPASAARRAVFALG